MDLEANIKPSNETQDDFSGQTSKGTFKPIWYRYSLYFHCSVVTCKIILTICSIVSLIGITLLSQYEMMYIYIYIYN
jgi:hypothetical protein